MKHTVSTLSVSSRKVALYVPFVGLMVSSLEMADKVEEVLDLARHLMLPCTM